jgi:hypothetical protein
MTISTILIIISSIVTALSYIVWWLRDFWINGVFLSESSYHLFILQFFLYQFLHWSIIHLFFNSVFIYIFWNWLEDLIWRRKFITFFIFNTFFVWISLFLLNSWNTNTIWISGFCMAILTYFTLELYSKDNPEYKWWVTAIVINLLIWFVPWISLVWHLFWSIGWLLFFLYNRNKD